MEKKVLDGKINEETIQRIADMLHLSYDEVYETTKEQMVSRCSPELVENAFANLKKRFHWATEERIINICSSNYSWLSCTPQKQDEKINFFANTFYDGNVHEMEKHANGSFTKYSNETIKETIDFYKNLLSIKDTQQVIKMFKKNMSLISIGRDRGQEVFDSLPDVLSCGPERSTEILIQYPRLFNMQVEDLKDRVSGVAEALNCSTKEAQFIASSNPRLLNTSTSVLKKTVEGLNEIGFDNDFISGNTMLMAAPIDGLKLRYMFAATKGLKIDAHGVLMMNLKTTYARYNYMLEHEGEAANFNLISQSVASFHRGERGMASPLQLLEMYPLDEKAILEIESDFQRYKEDREQIGIKVPDLHLTEKDINFALTSKTKAEMSQDNQ